MPTFVANEMHRVAQSRLCSPSDVGISIPCTVGVGHSRPHGSNVANFAVATYVIAFVDFAQAQTQSSPISGLFFYSIVYNNCMLLYII